MKSSASLHRQPIRWCRFFKFTRAASACGFVAGLACIAAAAADIPPAAKNVPATGRAPRLVIVKAVYGDLANAASTIDVTEKVAAAVQDDTLDVGADNDTFGDPAKGVSKQLRVDFTIDGVAGTKRMFQDGRLKISVKDKPDPATKSRPSKLVIRKAVYGVLPDGKFNDVTSIVTAMVGNDTLEVKAENESFGDPAFGTPKKLRVDYTFDGKERSKTVGEDETLKISASGE